MKCKMLITTNIVEGHDGGSSDGGDVFTLSVGRKELVSGLRTGVCSITVGNERETPLD